MMAMQWFGGIIECVKRFAGKHVKMADLGAALVGALSGILTGRVLAKLSKRRIQAPTDR